MSIAKEVICVHKRYSPAVLFLVLLFLISFPLNSSAALIRTSSGHNAGYLSWKNPETGYAAYLDDTCDLLTAEEEQALLEDMKPISEYCNVTFFSGDDGYGTAMQYAEETYRVYMNYDSGVLLMVDMYNRELTIYTDGEAYKVITPAKCRSITDNIYRYAVNGEFYSCASEAFAQSYLLLSGSRIAEPMKYISNPNPGCGLLRFGNKLIPIDGRLPKDSAMYRLFNTNFHELKSERSLKKEVKKEVRDMEGMLRKAEEAKNKEAKDGTRTDEGPA